MLPGINADDGHVSEKRVLIGCGDNLEDLCLGIPTLLGCEGGKAQYHGEHTSQPQPEP